MYRASRPSAYKRKPKRKSTYKRKRYGSVPMVIGRGAYNYPLTTAAGGNLGAAAAGALATRYGYTDGPVNHLAAAAGRKLGSMAGQKLGAWVGQKVLGRGAYSTNALIGDHDRRRVQGVADETGCITICNSEYLSDITTSGTAGFTVAQSIALNPGLAVSFPWLSQLAQNFEEYEWLGCIFEVRSALSEGNSTNPNGTVIIATQYNPYNADFNNKAQMENYDYAQSDKFTNTQFHGVECDPTKNHGSAILQVRSGAVPTGQDLRDFDLCTVNVATNTASTTAQNVAELWVHYKIRLGKSKITEVLGTTNPSVVFYGSYPLQAANMTGCNTLLGAAGYLAASYDGGVFTIKNAVVGQAYNLINTIVGTSLNTGTFNGLEILSGGTERAIFPDSTGNGKVSEFQVKSATQFVQLFAVTATSSVMRFNSSGSVGTGVVQHALLRIDLCNYNT